MIGDPVAISHALNLSQHLTPSASDVGLEFLLNQSGTTSSLADVDDIDADGNADGDGDCDAG